MLANEFIDLGINFLTENNEKFLSYNLAVDPGTNLVSISDKEKEAALEIPRRVWTTVAQERNIPLVQQADGFIRSADVKVYRNLSAGFDNVVNTLKGLGDTRGALVIGANAIFDNAGTIATLRKIKQAKSDIRIAVWSDNETRIDKLKSIGIGEVADIITSGMHSLDDVLHQLMETGISRERIMLINSDADLKNISVEVLEEFKAINLKAPNAKEGNLNSMPLVIARAIAAIFETEALVIEEYRDLSQNYIDGGQISAQDSAVFNDLVSQISDMPLVKVSDTVAQAQIVYDEVVDKI